MSDANELEHPGSIELVDGSTEAVVGTVDAADAPPAHHIVTTAAGDRRPVTKVVASVDGDRATLHQYGSDGELLRTLVQGRPPA